MESPDAFSPGSLSTSLAAVCTQYRLPDSKPIQPHEAPRAREPNCSFPTPLTVPDESVLLAELEVQLRDIVVKRTSLGRDLRVDARAACGAGQGFWNTAAVGLYLAATELVTGERYDKTM